MEEPGMRVEPDQPVSYEIKVRGRLEEKWADWFNGMKITCIGADPPLTVLNGTVLDQSALYGILSKIRDLNLTILSVALLESGEEEQNQNQRGD